MHPVCTVHSNPEQFLAVWCTFALWGGQRGSSGEDVALGVGDASHTCAAELEGHMRGSRCAELQSRVRPQALVLLR